MEDIELLVDAPAAALPARKLSRLRRAGSTPKAAPSDAPGGEEDGGALRERPPNDAQPRLATPQVAPSPSSSRRDADGAEEQTHSVAGLQQPEEEEEEEPRVRLPPALRELPLRRGAPAIAQCATSPTIPAGRRQLPRRGGRAGKLL